MLSFVRFGRGGALKRVALGGRGALAFAVGMAADGAVVAVGAGAAPAGHKSSAAMRPL